MSYTVRLISLKCITSQEDDGDEVYLTLNGEKIWSVTGDYKMRDTRQHKHHIREVDFVDGRYLVRDGWESIADFQAEAYTIGGLSGPSHLDVWDADQFSRDDHFGKLTFSENEIGHGHISGVAANAGAHYVLVYEVIGAAAE
jgi:hypothetical protein